MAWWQFTRQTQTDDKSACANPQTLDALTAALQALNHDKYLCWHAPPLRLVSVFDALKYDRSDLDMLSFRMQRHVMKALTGIGCQQKNGHVLVHTATSVRFIFPKFVALGASPFAATRYHQRHENDYWVLTPTQTACFMIEHLPFTDALKAIESLLQRQPINLYRILDFLEHKPAHQPFRQAIGRLITMQKQAVSREPLRLMRSL